MEWKTMESMEDWNQALLDSDKLPIMVFKHSTRCSVSMMALRLTQNRWDMPTDVHPYLLDLLAHRDVSSAISEDLGLTHESPQLILIRNQKVAHHANHGNIDPEDFKQYI